jgi:hypothetical protein
VENVIVNEKTGPNKPFDNFMFSLGQFYKITHADALHNQILKHCTDPIETADNITVFVNVIKNPSQNALCKNRCCFDS